MATATSRPPAPMASIPAAPQVGVWLSEPSRVWPGMEKRSSCTWWHMPLPGRENQMPCLAATVWMYLWSSAFSLPDWSILWSM